MSLVVDLNTCYPDVEIELLLTPIFADASWSNGRDDWDDDDDWEDEEDDGDEDGDGDEGDDEEEDEEEDDDGW